MKRLIAPAAIAAVAALIVASLLVGGYKITVTELLADPEQMRMFLISRVPRTIALVFAGVAMSVSGLIMQMITQNRFVEPTTTGTSQWAGLGILLMLILFPAASMPARMLAACLFAFAGTLVFLAVLRRVPLRSSLTVPLVGIMLGAVVGAVSTLIASNANLMQSMSAWRSGGFSGVVRGQYEPLWAVAIVTIATIVLADRFTVAGLGRDVATTVGVNYNRVVFLGTSMVALATGVTAVVVGFVPFLGLIVPNIVSMIRGDNTRSNILWVALLGSGLLIACDLVGRVIVAPMEIPVSVILGVVGAVTFILIVVSKRRALA